MKNKKDVNKLKKEYLKAIYNGDKVLAARLMNEIDENDFVWVCPLDDGTFISGADLGVGIRLSRKFLNQCSDDNS